MAKRTDANQPTIVASLRKFGASVQCTHTIGHGCPDLFVGYRLEIFAFEIKSPGGKLTPDEMEWRDMWRGNYHIIHTFEEAIEVITEK